MTFGRARMSGPTRCRSSEFFYLQRPKLFRWPMGKTAGNGFTFGGPRIFSGPWLNFQQPRLAVKNDYIFGGPNKPLKMFGAGKKCSVSVVQ
jgi:hypothetical protein